MPLYLIFNLLSKGALIFTGKLFGGIIASSIAFAILFKGKYSEKYYGCAFQKVDKNHIGVVTFGSPSFINKGFLGLKEKIFIPYFYNIKMENDYFPELIDFLILKMKIF